MNEFSQAGLTLLTQLESCRLEAYRDPGGVWTIGYGHTGFEVKPGLCWTQQNAEAALRQDLSATEAGVRAGLRQSLGNHQYSALVCLAFNIGLGAFAASSALRSVNARQWDDVPSDIAKWNKISVAGMLQTSPGLVGRRAAEIALWHLGLADPIPDFAALRDAAARAVTA